MQGSFRVWASPARPMGDDVIFWRLFSSRIEPGIDIISDRLLGHTTCELKHDEN